MKLLYRSIFFTLFVYTTPIQARYKIKVKLKQRAQAVKSRSTHKKTSVIFLISACLAGMAYYTLQVQKNHPSATQANDNQSTETTTTDIHRLPSEEETTNQNHPNLTTTETTLLQAAQVQNWQEVKDILQNQAINVTVIGEDENSVLDWAMYHAEIDIVKWIVENPCWNLQLNGNNPLLKRAMDNIYSSTLEFDKRVEIVQYLWGQGATEIGNDYPYKGINIATQVDNIDFVRMMLDKFFANGQNLTDNFKDDLDRAAATARFETHNSTIEETLVSYGAQIRASEQSEYNASLQNDTSPSAPISTENTHEITKKNFFTPQKEEKSLQITSPVNNKNT